MKQRRPRTDDGSSVRQFSLFQSKLTKAETHLLDLADYVYVHTSLKPMSEVLFFLSRALLILQHYKRGNLSSPKEIIHLYKDLRVGMRAEDSEEAHHFERLISECSGHLSFIFETIHEVQELTEGTDTLGLVFNTLLRGKFEAGEGLGTHLTPEEVVQPMVRMAFHCVDPKVRNLWSTQRKPQLVFGDIAAGTGRFGRALLEEISKGVNRPERDLAGFCHAYDQSRLSLEFGRIRFLLEDLNSGNFNISPDSILDDRITKLVGGFGILATNPPFGNNKYRWSPELRGTFHSRVLDALGLQRSGDRCDPAEVFLVRNLELLAPGGVLAIVLPDGVAYGHRFRELVETYEVVSSTRISILAAISLPVVTFSLGGTVAKTSFVIIKKASHELKNGPHVYAGTAHHVGFLKRGNIRIPDPAGNDLEKLCDEFCSGIEGLGKWTVPWRDTQSLSPNWLVTIGIPKRRSVSTVKLRDVAELIREFEDGSDHPKSRFHISVTNVDETGLIDLLSASRNKPITKPLVCKPGDIIVSCINPRIWRVALIPDQPQASWSCSPEFGVLRAKKGQDAWPLFIAFLHHVIRDQITARARGTSSSRQRVARHEMLQMEIPRHLLDSSVAGRIRRTRNRLYQIRSDELGLIRTFLDHHGFDSGRI